jgi:subtilisin family serine protease
MFRRTPALRALLALVALVALPGLARAADRIRVEKLDDLPRHTYRIDVPAVALLDDDEALMKLAHEVEADLQADLEKYEIGDATTLQGYYGTLGLIALLEERWDDYQAYFEKRLALEDKEAKRLTMSLFGRAYVAARRSGAEDLDAAIETELRRLVDPLPYELVGSDLKQAKGSAEIVSRTLMEGLMQERIQAQLDQTDGEMGKDLAEGLVSNGYAVRYYLPHKAALINVYSEYLAANEVEKQDIWAARDIELEAGAPGKPVTIAVWDSGVDMALFDGLRWTNANEIPGNGKDDDANGFVDDVNGIAWTLHSDRTTELLYPIEGGDDAAGDRRAMLQALMKGMSDLNANIDSEEAGQLKRALGSMARDEVGPFIEGLTEYSAYCHGTHVAGIATAGNPFVRLMAARITFGHTIIPELPTVEQSRKDAAAMAETIDYFRKNGVRVVNMSWGGDLASIESALEAHDAGGTPEERKALAREIFEIQKKGLEDAITEAKDILFVTSAGNSDNDILFEEVTPSMLDVPNLMVVGAVDQAGDETDFTSFGKVDVYANGFEVESWLPGGDRLPLSGTSMSSPQVTGLAAKVFALRPELSPTEVRELIQANTDERMAGDRPIRLIHPRRTIEAALAAEVTGTR